MTITTARDEAPVNVIDVLGEAYELTELVGQAPSRGIYVAGNEANGNALPQGFLVRQPGNTVTRPHFHEHNQFQVFVDGDGRFGKKPARPLTVQYASGHTPYGPIVAGEHGIVYFTLRQRWDPGAKYMPQMRDKLIRGRQRQHLVPDVPLDDTATLAGRTDAVLETLIAPAEDGLFAGIARIPPGQSWQAPDAAAGGGQYHVVVGGSAHSEGKRLSLWSCQFVFPGDAPVTVAAGDDGAQVLVLRFPR
jgi:hypothetical protein